MEVLHRAKANGRTAVFSAVLTFLLPCFACSGPGGMIPMRETRSERLLKMLSFETRQEQSAIAQRNALYHEPQLERFIEQVLAALMPSEAGSGILPRVVLVRDTTLDAYSFPDGAIYVHTGLLARLENEAELALLLAHELVHITRQHALQVLMAEQEGAAATSAEHDASDSLSWFQDMSAVFGRGRPSDKVLALRQILEQEADCLGLDMLVKANYDPHEAFEIFEHLAENPGLKKNDERAGRMFKLLSSSALGVARRPTDRNAFGKRLRPLRVTQAEHEIQHSQWDAALGCARHLLRDDPGQARGHYLLGEIFRRRDEPGDEQKALTHYHQAIASDPFSREPHKALGLIYLKRGQARRAKTFFQNALDLAVPSRDDAYIRSYITQCDTLIEGGTP